MMLASAAALNQQIAPPLTAAERAARSVFVGNIPYEATEEQLKEIFAQVGPVVSFRLVYDRETGKPKGYGFCEYQDVETAQSAMRNLNNHDFNGRPLRVGVAAGEQNKDEMKSMQQAIGGPPLESPYGDPVEPEKAPEAISRAVASLPPEQMYELMKQMKVCIQNNPNEARNMLLQNPQLAYALLQAQIVMKIVDPQVALAMLHRQTEQIPPLLPNQGEQEMQEDLRGGSIMSMESRSLASQGNGPSSIGRSEPIPSSAAMSMAGSMDYGGRGPGGPLMGPPGGPSGLIPAGLLGDHPHGPVAGQLPGMINDRMGGPGPGVTRGPAPAVDMRGVGGPGNLPGLGRPMGPGRVEPGGPMPMDMGDPRGLGGPRPDIRDPRQMASVGPPRSVPSGPVGPSAVPPRPPVSMGGMPGPGPGPMPPVSSHQGAPAGLPGLGGLAAAATAGPAVTSQDQEKAALIMQVLQLSDEQIRMLPPDQRQSILILKEQISRSTGGGRP